MNDDPKQYMIDYRMGQADESLVEAHLLLENGRYRAAINRTYYAMFYSVQALMIRRGVKSSKHQGAIAMFDIEFVKPGTIGREYSEWLHDAFESRLAADYGELVQPDLQQAQETLEKAKDFVNQAKRYLAEPGDKPGE